MDAMAVQVVLVHGIRTSATMWRAQVAHLRQRGTPVTAVDLPGHGTRRDEAFTLDGAFVTIDDAVQDAATRGPVLLVGHSMGGLLSIEYVGAAPRPPVAGFVAASCTSLPRGIGLAAYRFFTRRFDSLPDRGLGLTNRVLDRTLLPRRGPTSAPAATPSTRRTRPCRLSRSSTSWHPFAGSTCPCGS